MSPITRVACVVRISTALALSLLIAAPVSAEETGAVTGEVVFRVTLSGPVDPEDAFVIWSRCPDEWCDSSSGEHPVIACGADLADQVVCSATTYEWTIDLIPGTLEYRFERFSAVDHGQEAQVLHAGTWQVHAGRQVLSFEYAYPSPSSGAGRLPDTAVPAP